MLAYIGLRSLGVGQSGDVRDAQWYYHHPSERASELAYCNQHPQEQNGGECLAAVSAQTQVDAENATRQ
ncbi:MAG: hypothetical protein JO219_08255 [Candidatus Eremiobacteraeota bacterium]|nr:hypothetical protein [Candidatus Eremiobacteraeota bacterium]